MKQFIQSMLAALAKAVVRKYRPRIVAITGSVGKTSAKEAIVQVLKQSFEARGGAKNYNNELGVPLTVIGARSGGRSPLRWLIIFVKGLRLLLGRVDYPKFLVLEMAADHPGDIAYLADIAPPDIAVITAVAPAHTEFFGSIEAVEKEKATLIERLPPTGLAVLNADDERVRRMAGAAHGRIISYGFETGADVRAEGYVLHFEPREGVADAGLRFELSYQGARESVILKGVAGRPHVLAALAGTAVGLAAGMPLSEIAQGLLRYEGPPGRLRILAGIKGSILLDDTYNASPAAMLEALETLRAVAVEEGCRRVAVLGDMLELGAYGEEGHAAVGQRAAELGIDLLIAVGELSRDLARAGRSAGLPEERVFEFTDREKAGRFAQDRIEKGDVILVKGSRGMRLESVVKELMAEPLRADELLAH
ncbi:UDP-N-acetylmuramoyl-tripeptide--D-alanyl-D-alanine ligase [Candidatus Uhrbacteria bacterium]|nr:UDP-N-acetylmuramoyl-tripeptide--D-alanyl-D-alanine ligase [Candidatus Uhrbacteria bacterium]